MKTITIREPQFYSYQDEKYFFLWLEEIIALKRMKRESTGLVLDIDDPIDNDSLADLIALLTRYRIARTCLRIFLNEQNREWFSRSNAYWYRAVFKQ